MDDREICLRIGTFQSGGQSQKFTALKLDVVRVAVFLKFIFKGERRHSDGI